MMLIYVYIAIINANAILNLTILLLVAEYDDCTNSNADALAACLFRPSATMVFTS